MNIVCFAQTEWNESPSGPRQLLGRLARRGHRVLVIEPAPAGSPVGLGGLWNWRSRCRIRCVHDGLHVLTLRPLAGIAAGLANALRRRTIAAAAEAMGQWSPVAICTMPPQALLVRAVKPAAILYLASDVPMASEPGETQALRACDAILAGSGDSLAHYLNRHPHVLLLESGIDPAEFAPAALASAEPHPALKSLPHPRIGFVGAVDENLDQELVAALARHFSAGAVVLAGVVKDGLDLSRLRSLSNLHLPGPVGEPALAGLYRELDVLVMPYLRGASPHEARLLEFLAADLPVIATGVPDAHPAADAVRLAHSQEEFLDAVAAELEDRDHLAPQRRGAAEAASWQRRADQLEDHLRQAMQISADRRRRQRLPGPRPDRHGRQVVRVEPRLDGKDGSVRLLHDNYVQNGFSTQQHLVYLATRMIGLLYWALRVPVRLVEGKGLVRRILVVRNGHLGDTVVFLPTLAALRRRYPSAEITVTLAPDSGARPLLEASPLVDAVMPLDFFSRSRWERFLGAIRLLARGFDLSVGGVWYFHIPEAVYSGSPTRLGLYDGHPLQRYADRVVMLDPILHEAENNLRLVELVTGSVPLEARVPRLVLDEPALKQKAARMWHTLGLPRDAALLAMHPGSKRPSRRWPPEGFAELAEGLLRERPNLQVVFTGAGRDEQELIGRIRAMVPGDLRPRTHDGSRAGDLLGVIGFYDTCKLLVCNDTGVMHVARARGVPLVAIIGPENDRRWGPHPLGPGPAVTVRNQVPGTPHGKWACQWNLSLASIDAPRIKRHCDAILDGTFATVHNLKPVEAGGERFYPLVRDFRRLSFAQLQELGLDLPRVAVVLTTDPSLLAGVGRRATAEEVAAAARDLRRQQYPSIQCLLVAADMGQFRGLDIGHASVIQVPRDPDGAWASVLGATNARLFWPLGPLSRLEPTAVANRVSVFLRGPNAPVIDDQRAWPARTLIESDFVNGPWMIDRSALETRLTHPVGRSRSATQAQRPDLVYNMVAPQVPA